jgi:hypothetical protein
MNKLCCLIVIFFTCGVCVAQNLVPNPSFEDTAACPSGINAVNDAIGWSRYRGSPDYFNNCNTGLVGVPTNFCGFQSAITGVAYCGFLSYAAGGINAREIIGAQLNQQLAMGQTYFISFYVNRSYSAMYHNNIATNKLGLKFSTVPFDVFNPIPINDSAHVYTNTIIIDTLNWTKISGTFTTDSAYNYIAIGNFFTDSLTSHISFDSSASFAYYYVDDVCISTDSLTCNSAVGINEVKNKKDFTLFPNPFSNKLTITSKTNEPLEITLFDLTSRKLLQQQFTNSTTINTSQLSKGIYIYQLSNKNGVIKKGKVVKE